MSFKENKVVMACRIAPDMKEMLEQEASDNEKSLSAYIEDVISKREELSAVEFREQEKEKLKVSLEQEMRVNKRLLTENERLRNENAVLENDVRKNQQRLFWLDDGDIGNVTKLVSRLNHKFPKLSNKEILLVSLATSLHNEENSWEIHKMEDFLNEYPDYLTSKLPTR